MISHSKEKWIRGAIIGTVMVLLALSPAYWMNRDDNRPSTSGGLTADANQTATSDGLTMSLESVTVSPGRTEMAFALELPEFAVSSEQESPLGVIAPGDQVELVNISPNEQDGMNFRVKPHQPSENQLLLTMILGKAVDPAEPVTVTFTELPILDGRETKTFSGPWEFQIAPDQLRIDDPTASNVGGETKERDGVRVRFDRVQQRPSELSVYYTVSSSREYPVMPVGLGVELVFPHQSVVKPLRTEALGGKNGPIQTGQETEYVATFEEPIEPLDEALVTFGPFVTSNGTASSLTIDDPFGDWTAEPVVVNGDQFSVTDVYVEETPARRLLKVVVVNAEPPSEASVLFHGVHGTEVTATDGQGHEHRILTASTGLRKADNGSIQGAGPSTFGFDVTDVDRSSMERLTITVNHSSLLLDGPYAFDIAAP